MLKKLALIFVLFFLSMAAHATTVTGQVKDPVGQLYRTCTGSANFIGQNSNPAAGPYRLGGVSTFQTVVPIFCDGSARFTVSLASNTLITPTPSQWSFSICTAMGVYPGPPICFTTLITITGTSQDVTTQLQAASAPLPPYAPILEVNGVPNGSQSLLNLINGSNITIVDNGVGGVTISASGGGGGGGGGLPDPGSNGVVFRTALNTTASIPNVASGSIFVTTGPALLPVTQTKAIYDVRDWATCDTPTSAPTTGTNATSGIATMLNSIGTTQRATVRLIGTTTQSALCRVANLYWGPNITIDTSGGGGLALITDSTAPGGGAIDAAGSTAAFNNSSNSCSVTVTPSGAGETYYLYTGFGFGAGALVSAPTSTVASDVILLTPVYQSNNNVSYLTDGWVVANVVGGSRTFTFNYHNSAGAALNTWNSCRAIAISGIGVTPGLDGGTGASTQGVASPMSAGAYTFQAGSVILAQGGQHNDTETCTVGGGFTQPAAPLGQVGTSGTDCFQYINVSGAGALTATQAISSAPTGLAWTYTSIGLRPASAVNAILGGIINPDLHQIFYNANSGQGTVDFTGNLVLKTVFPEWWGAAPGNPAATNTAPLQAAEHGAFGTNRTNASGLSIYNKQLFLSGMYSINDEIQFYNVIGNSTSRWDISCAAGGGIKQTVANKRIWDGQSNAYGTIHSCSFQGSASSTKPLVDWDYDGITTSSLATQFITCYDCSFVGNGLVDVGLLIAKSGGGAQGSNIYCINCAGQGFTGAVLQVGGNGTGRNVGRSYALNALNIGWTGDMQNCPLYGLATYGGGYVVVDNSSFECVSPLASYLTSAATAVDVYGEATQGPVTVSNTRSEDLQLIHASSPKVYNTSQIDQSTAFYSPVNCLAGASEPLNWFIHGSDKGSDGALYQVTVHGTAFGGLCLTQASSGSATTIVDTNQRIAGSTTIKTFQSGETVTQAVTGATGTLLNVPLSTTSVTGSVTSGTFVFGETLTQSVTGVTATEQAPSPTGSATLFMTNLSGTANNSNTWVGGTSGAVYTPNAAPVFAVASPVMLITAAVGAPDNSHNWTGGTSAAVYVPTAVPVNDVNWSVNQFVGGAGAQQQVTIWGGAGNGTVCSPITSNTATSITFTSCTSNYFNVHSATFNTTSQFIVEPCWGCTVTQSGDFTFAKVTPVVIGGDNVNTSSSACVIQDVQTSGGKILCNTNLGRFTRIHNLTVSRPDWYGGTGTGSNLSSPIIPEVMDQVQIVRPYSTITAAALKWSIAGRNSNTNLVNSPLQMQMGTHQIVWNTAVSDGGPSANDVSLGGRTDPGAGTNAFRNRVEYCTAFSSGACTASMFGAPAPSAFNVTDQAGTATQLGGGPSTGSGTPGNVEIWTGSTAGSGTSVNTGTRKWYWDGATGHLFASTDNTNDIGASGATRPRTVYAGTSVVAPNVILSGLAPTTLTDGATITWNVAGWSLQNAAVTLGGNRTLNVSNIVDGGNYELYITQDATPPRTLTLGTGCTWKVFNGGAGAITLTNAANATDIVTFSVKGTTCYVTVGNNFN